MVISEINPYVRFAAYIAFPTQKAYSVSPDCRIFFITKGEGVLRLQSTCCAFAPFSLIYIPAGTGYRFITHAPAGAIAVNFDYDQCRSGQEMPFAPTPVQHISDLPGEAAAQVTDCASLNRPLFLENGAKLQVALQQLVQESALKNPYFREKLSGMLKILLVEMLGCCSKEHLSQRTDGRFEEALSYIREHYREDLTNAAVAQRVGYHPYYLNRLFQELEGTSIHRYLNACRLNAAEQLLLSTELSVTDVATAVGFNTSVSFSQNFKNKNGISPAQYRRLCRRSI